MALLFKTARVLIYKKCSTAFYMGRILFSLFFASAFNRRPYYILLNFTDQLMQLSLLFIYSSVISFAPAALFLSCKWLFFRLNMKKSMNFWKVLPQLLAHIVYRAADYLDIRLWLLIYCLITLNILMELSGIFSVPILLFFFAFLSFLLLLSFGICSVFLRQYTVSLQNGSYCPRVQGCLV